MRSCLTIVLCLILILLILPMFVLLTTSNGCSIERDKRDTLEFDVNKFGVCPAASSFCRSLNAEPLTWNGEGECGCECRNDYATFMEGANSCVKNDQVHDGCQIYSEGSSISDPLGVIEKGEKLRLSLKTTGYKCRLDKSLSSYRNAGSWTAFSSSSLPFKLKQEKIKKGRGNRRKKRERQRRRREYSYYVKLETLPNYLRGRLVKLGLNCDSQGTRCFVFKVEGQLESNNCASLFSVKPSTVALETTLHLTDDGLIGNKRTTLQTTAATTPSYTSSVIAASPSTIIIASTQTYALSTMTATPTKITDTIRILLLPLSTTKPTMIITATQTPLLSTTTTAPSTIIATRKMPPLSTTNTTLSKVHVTASIATKSLSSSLTSSLSSSSSSSSSSTITTTTTTNATETIGSWKGLLSTNQPSTIIESSVFAFRKQVTMSLVPTTAFSQSEASIIRPTTDTSPTKKDILVKKRNEGDDKNLLPLVGGVTGAILLVTVAVILLCCIKKRRSKRRPDEAGLSGHQLQEVGSPNEGYPTRPESLYSEIEDDGISYQALLVQNRDSHDYGKLCNSNQVRLPSLTEPIYTCPETAKKSSYAQGASTEYDYATLEGNESNEKKGAAQSKRDSEYCEIRRSYTPDLDCNKDSGMVYDYAVVEGKERRNKKTLLEQLNKNESQPSESKDSPNYYQVLEEPNLSSSVTDSTNAASTTLPSRKERRKKATLVQKLNMNENQPSELKESTNYYRVLEGPEPSSSVTDSTYAASTTPRSPVYAVVKNSEAPMLSSPSEHLMTEVSVYPHKMKDFSNNNENPLQNTTAVDHKYASI